ncbi:MAG: DUF1616 domain-containing protein [Methanothrix sp.]|nr:DUF1616 domain-containing protein [Methanothrix sp.]
MRLAWPPPRHLIASVLISVVALALVHLSPPSLQDILSPLALILVFLIPGYLATLSVFPGKSDLSGKGRAFLCLASSAMFAGLFSLILTVTPRGLQSASLATILSLLAIFLAAVAYGRWSNLPRNRRFLLMPKRGLGSTRPFSRAALAILLLAACFIAALAFAFGPYQLPFVEPSANIEAAASGEALTTPSSSFDEEKVQIKSYPPQEEDILVVDLSQNNSSNASFIKSTDSNIEEDKSEAAVFSMGGGGGGGSSSSSSSQTVTKKPASSKALQPEKKVSTSPTAANLSNTSLTSQDNQTLMGNLTLTGNLTDTPNQTENLTLDQAASPETEPEANPEPLPSSTINDTNETNAVNATIEQGVTTKQDVMMEQDLSEPISVPPPDANVSLNAAQNNNDSTDKSSGLTIAEIAESSAISSQEGPSPESPSIETDLSRTIRQSEIDLNISDGEESDNSNLPPVLKALVPDRASPQLQGSAIFWKAEATDEEGDKILYRFFLDGREVRKWSKINSWSWLTQGLPAGDYQITVLAIDGNHAAQDSFDSIINASFTLSLPNQAPVLQQLKPDKASPQGKGSIITWTASASDPDNDQINFRFMKNDKAASDWSTSSSWVWDTSSEKPGEYKITVLAKDGLHASRDAFDSSLEDKFVLTLPNSIPEVTELKADRPSPQTAGSAITWTASAVDPDGDAISYKFLVNDIEAGQWSPSNSWVWDTSSVSPGEYRIKVLARDGRHSSEESFDSFKDAVMTIAVADLNQPPVLSSLVSDIASPDVQGVTVVWKSEAYDPDGDKILYKFQLGGRDMGRWSESASWKWSTRDLPPGDYKIRVLARDGKHAPESSFDSSKDAVFSLISEIDQQINQLMNKRSKDASVQENYQSMDIRVTSGNGTNSNVVLGKGNGTI